MRANLWWFMIDFCFAFNCNALDFCYLTYCCCRCCCFLRFFTRNIRILALVGRLVRVCIWYFVDFYGFTHMRACSFGDTYSLCIFLFWILYVIDFIIFFLAHSKPVKAILKSLNIFMLCHKVTNAINNNVIFNQFKNSQQWKH